MSSALDSQGTLLKVGNGASPEVFTEISEVSNIQGPGGNATQVDVTSLSSTAKEWRMGLQDNGQITADLNYVPQNTQHEALLTAKDNQTLLNFTLTFTDSPASVWQFSAYVLAFSISNAVDDATRGQLTLLISGAIVRP